MEWVVEGEDVLFQCRASYKGRAGTLFATNKRVAWYQTSVTIPQISLPLELLKGVPKSNKEGSDKVLLKFEPKEPIKGQTEFRFEFSSGVRAADREGIVRVMEQLLGRPQPPPPMAAPLLPTLGSSTGSSASQSQGRESKGQRAIREAQQEGIQDGGNARRRAAALAGDTSLRMMYEELVTSGLISEEEFWHNRRADLDKFKAAAASQIAGPESALVSDLRPTMVKPGEIHYRLTSAMIAQIFRENPVVRRAYDNNVPHKVTESEFWTEYLQSRYVESLANKPKRAVAGDMFAEAERAMELERRKGPVDIGFDVDLRPQEGEATGVEDAQEPASLTTAGVAGIVESVIQKFNHHSALVLSSAAEARRAAAASTSGLEDDLNPLSLPSAVSLELRAVPVGPADLDELQVPEFDNDDGGRRPMDSAPDGEAEAGPVISQEALTAYCVAISSGRLAVDSASLFQRPSSAGGAALRSAGSDAAAASAVASKPPSEADRAQLLRVQELSRHYWGCFPITSQASVAKSRRLVQELKKQLPSNYEPVVLMVNAVLRHAQSNGV